MGSYDMLPNGEQVKCWGCEGKTYKVGDTVGSLGGADTYIALLAEGGFVVVIRGVIRIYMPDEKKSYFPEDFPLIACFNKWGGRVVTYEDLEHSNIVGGHYYSWLDKKGGLDGFQNIQR